MGLDIFFESKNKENEEVAYFRKVNFLLPYFGYEENCTHIEITKQQVEDIVGDCKKLLVIQLTETNEKFVEKAQEIMPTERGFFFGSTEYDEWYVHDLKEVLEKFSKLLETFDFENDTLLMHCSW